MKKAILIFAHKDPEYLNLFAKQLLYKTNGETDIFFHIDQNNVHIEKQIVINDNVFLIQNSIPIKWGNDTMVKALVNCFNEIVNRGKTYDYFLILTGQDIMVRKDLDTFLENNKGKIFIETRPFDQNKLISLKHYFPDFMCSCLGDRRNPKRWLRGIYYRLMRIGLIPEKKVNYDISDINFYFSYNWSAMPFNVLVYINDFLQENKGFLDLYMNTPVPEDAFLGTLIMNSPYRYNVSFLDDGRSETLTYWKAFYNSERMVELTIDDIEAIRDSGCYFARKAEYYKCPDFVNYYLSNILED